MTDRAREQAEAELAERPKEVTQEAKLLGQVIKVRRQRAGRTQMQIAKAAGCDQKTISTIEAGEANPSMFTLVGLVSAKMFSWSELEQIGLSE